MRWIHQWFFHAEHSSGRDPVAILCDVSPGTDVFLLSRSFLSIINASIDFL